MAQNNAWYKIPLVLAFCVLLGWRNKTVASDNGVLLRIRNFHPLSSQHSLEEIAEPY